MPAHAGIVQTTENSAASIIPSRIVCPSNSLQSRLSWKPSQRWAIFLCSFFFLDVAPLGRLHQIFVRSVRRAAMKEAIANHDRHCTDHARGGDSNRSPIIQTHVDDVVARALLAKVGTHDRHVALFKPFFDLTRVDLYLMAHARRRRTFIGR